MLDRIAHITLTLLADPIVSAMLAALFADVMLKLRPELAKLAPYSHRYAWIKTGLAAIAPRLVPAAVAFSKAAIGAKHPDVEKLIEMGAAAVPGVPPRGNGGHARTDALGFVIAVWLVGSLLASIALHGCSGTQLDREMRAADDLGLAANRAEPVWMNAYRIDGRAAADHACTNTADPACVQLRTDAVHAVEARWAHVGDQWETARQDHDALASCLEAAHRSDGGVCPDADAKSAALAAAIMTYRCEVHALGHPELDALGSAPLSCGGAR